MPPTTKRPEPVPPDELENIAYGLIDPNGNLFKVDYYGNHSSVMYRLQEHGIVDFGLAYEKMVHISDGDFDHARKYNDSRRITQKQFDTMFDYSLARGFEFPWDTLEVVRHTKDAALQLAYVGTTNLVRNTMTAKPFPCVTVIAINE